MKLNKSIEDTIIFTDLDSTLLDHESYSFEPALEMLNFIKQHKIPLIIVTSKTQKEVVSIQKKLGITTPFIVENGAGIIYPTDDGKYRVETLGFTYDEIRNYFEKYQRSIKMRGFFDMSVQEISKLTELSMAQAICAKERTFTEPFLLENENDFDKIKKMANEDSLDVVKGGRFYHLISLGQDKAVAMNKVVEYFEKEENQKYSTIALGDSANDLKMLQSADTAILIPQKDGNYFECDIKGLIRAEEAAPLGWNNTLKEYFNVK